MTVVYVVQLSRLRFAQRVTLRGEWRRCMRRLVVLLLMSFVCLSGSNLYAFSGGTGSAGDPYLISTAAELNSVGSNSTYWASSFKLTANIDMSAYIGTSYNIIGSSTTKFTGRFDGNGFVISDLTYTTALVQDYVGMFGYTDHAYIQNVRLTNVSISSSGANIGGLIGWQNYGTTINCSTTGSVSGGNGVGGLAGNLNGDSVSKITYCYSTASVTGPVRVGGLIGLADGPVSYSYSTGTVTANSGSTSYIGGLIGDQYYATVSNCFTTGNVNVSATSSFIGGLTGNQGYSTMTNCYCTGTINGGAGNSYVGGLIGWQYGSNMTNCYSASLVNVSSTNYIGGLIGYSSTTTPSTMTACFWDTTVSTKTDGVGNQDPDPSGVTGKTTAQMKTTSTFTSAGWDFTSPVWVMPVETVTYPVLSWQPSVYGGGNGTSGYPWKIYTKSQLEYLGSHTADYNKYFIVMADIDLTGTTYTQAIIAPDTNSASGGFQGTGFNGNFNGNGHVISNMTINMPDADFAGLFGYIYGSGQVINLGVEFVNVTGRQYVGSLAGASSNVSGCYATGTVSSSGDNYVGGLTGYNSGTITGCYASPTVNGYYSTGGLTGYNNASGTISNSYATGAVNGNSYIGGLVGQNLGSVSTSYATGTADGTDYVGGLTGNNYGTISNSYATGAAAGLVFWFPPSTYHHSYYVGGLIGYNSGTVTGCFAQGSATRQGMGGSLYHAGGLVGYNISGSITSCYALGLVTGTTNVGGFVGNHYSGSITNCYSSGSVSGTTSVGGLAGHNTSGSITNSFWDTDASGQPTSAGGTGKTTAQMKTESTFTAASWDFSWVDGDSADWVLWIEGQSYPTLAWQPATFSGGGGTLADPWKIDKAQHLLYLCYNSAYYNGSYLMTADIDMSAYTGTMYKPIGTSTTKFTGDFDGGGHIVSHLTYSTSSIISNVGMFGYTSAATIQNLGLENVTVHTHGDAAGGLVGYHYRGHIYKCYTTGAVEGRDSIGGLMGAELGSTDNSYSTASVTSTGTNGGAGGLAGAISGYLLYGVRTCYSAGYVTGNANVGGLIGYSSSGLVENSFWDTETSGQPTSAGGTGKTTTQMMNRTTFTAAGWDFLAETANGTNDYWRLCTRGVSYPQMTWSFATKGDFACANGTTLVDFPYLAQHWLLTGCTYSNDYCGWADMDVSGSVDTADLLIFAENWL
jgi:hypothetical protein